MAEAITQLGNVFYNEQNYDEAIAHYTEAIRLKLVYAAAFNNRGNAFAGKGEYNKAIADYTEAVRLKPDYAIAYYNRGSKYRNIGKFDQALADREEAIRLKPGLKDLGPKLSLDIVLRHIFDSDADEIFEMYNDAEKVIKEEKEKPEKIAEAYLKQSLYLFLNEKEENGKAAIKKAADLYSGMDEADVSQTIPRRYVLRQQCFHPAMPLMHTATGVLSTKRWGSGIRRKRILPNWTGKLPISGEEKRAFCLL
jgi:tetratricopeptide (TPR) repeat protein